MADEMTLAALAETLTTTLGDARNRNADADAPTRYIRVAVADLHRVRPRLRLHTITLAAGVARYEMPTDAVRVQRTGWHAAWQAIAPWNRMGVTLPVATVHTAGAARELELSPAPSAAFLALVGHIHSLHYYAQHTVGETEADTSVPLEDRALVILRAQAEAMKEIALSNSGKPGSIKGGDASMPRNSTPAAVYQELMAEFERS